VLPERRFVPQPPHVPRHRHILDGQMFACTADEIDSALMWNPPTGEQLVALGLEESHGHDRSHVYRVLEQHKPK
jgi:hypothetical protein